MNPRFCLSQQAEDCEGVGFHLGRQRGAADQSLDFPPGDVRVAMPDRHGVRGRRVVMIITGVVMIIPEIVIGRLCSGRIDEKTQSVQAMVLVRFQPAATQPRQPHRVDRFKQTVLLFRKGMHQGGDEHVSCNASHRV